MEMEYNPSGGDYPDYNVTGNDTTSELGGDETCGGYLMIKEIFILKVRLIHRF